MRNELRHHGVKGQKWGVRKNKSKMSPNIQRGAAVVNSKKARKVAAIVSSTAAVASGALWVASALVPGLGVLNTAAAVANVASMAIAPK